MESCIARMFAAVGRSIPFLAAIALVGTLQATQASAIPIQLTFGAISQENRGPWPFEFTDTFIGLEAPGFALHTDPRFDNLLLFIDVPPGTSVNLSHDDAACIAAVTDGAVAGDSRKPDLSRPGLHGVWQPRDHHAELRRWPTGHDTVFP